MMEEKRAVYSSPRDKKRKWAILGAVLGALFIILAIFLALYYTVFKGNKSSNGAASGNNGQSSSPGATRTSGSPQPTASSLPVTGGDGSKITMEDGTTFTYKNAFGGTWYSDPKDPLNNAAQAQSWTPPINQTFQYGIDQIRGVNIGGWLNTEPFITPALYQKYAPQAVDEWTLSLAMRADTSAGGGIKQIEDHYKTFITEKDFAEIAAAGLNHVRIPLGWWAIEVRGDEPFLPKVSWQYFLKAIEWCRKYGIRIKLDFHAHPGSQNGWNHSGRLGEINWLRGPMGYANAQRSLDYIRVLAEFVAQPQYRDVVTIFGIVNENRIAEIGMENVRRFNYAAYEIIRTAGGTGAGNGPYISLSDGFQGQSNWADYLPGADHLALDTHPYLAFGTQSPDPVTAYTNIPCTAWAPGFNQSMSSFGLSMAGEFSLAYTDCGLFLNTATSGARYEGNFPGGGAAVGQCSDVTNWESWTTQHKTDMMDFAKHSMDALQNWFFWTWKIGPSAASGRIETPHWAYQLGVDNGWIPKDPRDSRGSCPSTAPFVGPLSAPQTGGPGAGNIAAADKAQWSWPPTSITMGGAVPTLPAYVPSGAVPTLPAATFTAAAKVDVGSGWANPADNALFMVEAQGCTYLDPWCGPNAVVPPVCAAAHAANKRAAQPMPSTP